MAAACLAAAISATSAGAGTVSYGSSHGWSVNGWTFGGASHGKYDSKRGDKDDKGRGSYSPFSGNSPFHGSWGNLPKGGHDWFKGSHWDGKGHKPGHGGSVVTTPAPVPLPAALPLVLGGLGALAIARGRRRKS